MKAESRGERDVGWAAPCADGWMDGWMDVNCKGTGRDKRIDQKSQRSTSPHP